MVNSGIFPNPNLVYVLPNTSLIQIDEFKAQLKAEFLSLGVLLTFWGQVILFVGGCPMHCRIFRSVPGLYPLDASSNS